jgi:putative aldouronate transport system substrate-binding protein
MSFITYIESDVLEQKIMTLEDTKPYTLESGMGTYIVNNSFWVTSPILAAEIYDRVKHAKLTGDTSGMNHFWIMAKYLEGHDFAATGNPASIGAYLQTYAERCAYAINTDVVKNNRLFPTYPRGPKPEEVAKHESALNDLLRKGFTKIITGVEPLPYFDSLVTEWKAAGGDIATAIMNSGSI